ncbi:pyroglutamyl-peptidase [Mesorhizobium sp. J18]|uniref:pyroglutamyl-peptidase I n=1 Tax=Mesorhizobium sp. J18 TaxID=935263 RepID=UPI00119AE705|nr:pyroglutamyl-peptidase I [Mesorhizobium sp. J18]TWH01285.1 pyroglutamyl-peptidase [Mesorhizobium sp. J18]
MSDRPRILVTGFSVFPGAPVNPTEKVIERLRGDAVWLARHGNIRLEVLPVEYGQIPGRLEALGNEFAPDIAIHFGLSAKAEGFTLERLARNEIAAGRPDNAGCLPELTQIVGGGGDIAATLPVKAIQEALVARNLPVSLSDDAGGYLCNYLFYHSCGQVCAGFAPDMAGFIHVPPLADGEAPLNAMALQDLVAGATVIIDTCSAAWLAERRAEMA